MNRAIINQQLLTGDICSFACT